MNDNTTPCEHANIQTWRFKDTGEAVRLWSCADCGRKFEPVAAAQPPAAQADSIVEAWLLGRAVQYLVLGGHDDEWTDFSGGGKPNTGSKRLAWRLKPTPQAQSVPATGAQSWRPIETAPKSSRVMFVVQGFNVTSEESRAYNYTTDPYCVWPEDGGWRRWPHQFQPTHWLPLPAAPTGDKA